jgi:hypothetical protein
MCGSYDVEPPDDPGGAVYGTATIRADKRLQCDGCAGWIEPGAYCSEVLCEELPESLEDEDDEDHEPTESSFYLHLQCRNVCEEIGYYGGDVIQNLEHDEEKGWDWVQHFRAVAVWAAGGVYKNWKDKS